MSELLPRELLKVASRVACRSGDAVGLILGQQLLSLDALVAAQLTVMMLPAALQLSVAPLGVEEQAETRAQDLELLCLRKLRTLLGNLSAGPL
ncbi:hypothetical protein [Pseudomonas sp.]|uniref:hypothetical protein n=1 Tax=Pseudomonas sp. TaxID=306 RepID=UPI00356B32DD